MYKYFNITILQMKTEVFRMFTNVELFTSFYKLQSAIYLGFLLLKHDFEQMGYADNRTKSLLN